MKKASVEVKGLKVTTLLSPEWLASADLVGPEGQPAGSPVIEISLGGAAGVTVLAMLNGKSVRKAQKTIAELGPDNVVVLLQGNLIPGSMAGGWVLDGAGLSCTPKTPKPAVGSGE